MMRVKNAFSDHFNLRAGGNLAVQFGAIPDGLPGFLPSCCAIKRAAERAASRRGSNIRIFLPARQGASSNASGTRVVLPRRRRLQQCGAVLLKGVLQF